MMTPDQKTGYRTEVRDGMRIDWDVPISMDDGVVLRADVFRPVDDGRYPPLLTYGPYAKGLAFQDGYGDSWDVMVRDHPDVAAGSSNLYQNWEVVDPEKWVPHGYVCVRVDSRGCGRSPGEVNPFSPRETRDFAACIEWAGTQSWSNGKVGLTEFLITRLINGRWPHCSRRIWQRCVCGRALRTGIAILHTMEAYIALSGRTGTTCKLSRSSTA